MMKKAFSLLCVCILVLAMAVPALAATQGQVDNLADIVGKTPTNSEAAKELADAVKNDKSLVVGEEISGAMRAALLVATNYTPQVNTTVNGYGVKAYHSLGMDQRLTVSQVTFENGKLTVTAQFEGGAQSALGTYIMVEVPETLEMGATYMWECEGQTGVAFVKGTSSNGSSIMFYAPHFSTYTITAVNSQTPAPSPAPSVLANTASDMSFAVVGIVALGALMVVGSAVALKKRGAKN